METFVTALRMPKELALFAEEYGKERDWSRNKAIINIVRDKKKEIENAKQQEQSQD